MFRLAWQRPRPPWHASQRPRHASQRPRHALQRPRPSRHAFSQGPRSPACLVVHYSLGFTAYKAASGGVFLRCGSVKTLRKGMPRRPRTLQSMPRTLQSMPRMLRSMPRRPRTLPSMPRSCQASLHILGSHTNNYISNKIIIF